MIKRWIHPSKVKNDSLKVTISDSRYTLTPHEKKDDEKKPPEVEDQSTRRKKPAKPAVSGVPTRRVRTQATNTANAYVPRLNKHQFKPVVLGSSSAGSSSSASNSSNASKPHVESQQKPSRMFETYTINQAIAAGVPVIITKDEAERRKVLKKIHQEDVNFMEGLAAKPSYPVNRRGWQNGGDKGRGKPKQVKVDKGSDKVKEVKEDKGKGKAQQAKEDKGKGKSKQVQQARAKGYVGRRSIHWFRKSSQ